MAEILTDSEVSEIEAALQGFKSRRPQLVHTARVMFETRLAKYNDPRNEEWNLDDITDKWERHAWSAYLDLIETEKIAGNIPRLVESHRALAAERDQSDELLKLWWSAFGTSQVTHARSRLRKAEEAEAKVPELQERIRTLESACEAARDVLALLVPYGKIHTVDGVRYPDGSHSEAVDRGERILNELRTFVGKGSD